MAFQYTTQLTVNGWTSANLFSLLTTDGYIGGPKVNSITIVNNSTVVTYVHFTSNGATAPATASKGLPVGTTAAPASAITVEDVDLATTWINTASSTGITISVIGA